MKKIFTRIGLAALSIFFGWAVTLDSRYVSAKEPVGSSEFHKSGQEKIRKKSFFALLQDVNASIECAGISGGDYTARIIRQVQFDALTIRDWFLQFKFREVNLLDPSPSQLDHELEYLGIGYKTPNGKIRFFWDHTCHNPARKLPKNRRNDIHWNELGIGYESTGMMLGHKNDRIEFNSVSEWLNNINWRASLSKIWMRTENDYEWMFKLGIRDDVFRTGNHVFYIQLDLSSVYHNRGINLDPGLEIGDRIRLNENIYLIPFVSYERFHDWYGLGESEYFFSAGLCLEMGLGHENHNNSPNSRNSKILWTPRLHITGGYANIIDNNDYGHSGDAAIDLDLIKLDRNKTLRLNTYAAMLTLPHDYNPYTINYKIGPSLKIDLDNSVLTLFHRYSCLYGLENKGIARNYNLLGLELKNKNVFNWNWNVKIGSYPSTRNFDYWGDLHANLAYNFYTGRIIPYVNCSGHYLVGNNSVFGHAIQAGIKISGKVGGFSVYICRQDDFDVFRFGKGTQKLVGIKFQF